MKIEFKDVAHLYMNCELKVHAASFRANDGSRSRINRHNGAILSPSILADLHERTFQWGDFTPILRPLSSMTVEERAQIGYQEEDRFMDLWKDGQISKNTFCCWMFPEILKMNIDLFGLIDSGQAIDATTLEPNPYQK